MLESQDLLKNLKQMIDDLLLDGVALAFSGGVDSALLLEVCSLRQKIVGGNLEAVIFQTKLHPQSDLTVARQMAIDAGVYYKVIDIDEFSDAEINNNPIDRCYRCKRLLFTKLKKYAAKRGLKNCLDGTNFDDLQVYRPGVKALSELGIISPLAQLGFHKDEIRELAAILGISCAEKPSTPCLATRLPYNTHLDPDLLLQIDQAENFIRSKGFETVRLRIHGDTVRIEILPQQFNEFIQRKDEILVFLKEFGFYYLTLDLEGFRSGSMDIGINMS